MTTSRGPVTAGGDLDFGTPAELIGHPARSAILVALLDGRALPMSMLAGEAGVSPSTASAHLSRLVDGGLLRVSKQGRYRYYELASERVASALEALATLAPAQPIRSLRADSRARALRMARTCYDHAAGHLGVAVMDALVRQGAVTGGDGLHHPDRVTEDRLAAPGRDLDYRLTDTGRALLDRLGVELAQRRRRRLVAYCVDWTEQRHHLAGLLGAALLTRFRELDWLRPHAHGIPRALTVTDTGRREFTRVLDIDPGQFAPEHTDAERAGGGRSGAGRAGAMGGVDGVGA